LHNSKSAIPNTLLFSRTVPYYTILYW
jgi:hypothetical protein